MVSLCFPPHGDVAITMEQREKLQRLDVRPRLVGVGGGDAGAAAGALRAQEVRQEDAWVWVSYIP